LKAGHLLYGQTVWIFFLCSDNALPWKQPAISVVWKFYNSESKALYTIVPRIKTVPLIKTVLWLRPHIFGSNQHIWQ